MDNRVVGVLGGGQLGRMFAEAANRLNVPIAILDAPGSSAKQILANDRHVNGSFSKREDVLALAAKCDVLTVEIEHVDTAVLIELEKQGKVQVQPSGETIRVIQDKFLQKQVLWKGDVPTCEAESVESTEDALLSVGRKYGFPYMLKSRTQAYDGRGNFAVMTEKDVQAALKALANRPLYAERWSKFDKELAVIVVKTKEAVGSWEEATLAYPAVETVHEDSICKLVFAPARGVSREVLAKAEALGRRAVAQFKGKGVFAVEMFLVGSDILVNEIAPRPHNSGHYTIEACQMSQYEAHLRAILDLPFPKSARRGAELNTKDTAAIMLNILGSSQADSCQKLAAKALEVPGAHVHLYGKGEARKARKMGHITVVASSMAEAEARIQPLVELADSFRDSPSQIKSVQAKSKHALVAVTMGSDSDLPVLKPGLALLEQWNVPYMVTITSAHRTPALMFKFAQEAADRGIKVIIAAAGGAAHLPGMIAASTPLPVIGVPVRASSLDGLDSLLSIVQMPRGVPVATVAINNSINAALLAIRILGASDSELLQKMQEYMDSMATEVTAKASKLELGGWEEYQLEKK